MKKLITFTLAFLLAVCSFAAEKNLYLHGHIKDAVTKMDLLEAKVITYKADGSVKDTIPADKGMRWVGGAWDKTSQFSLEVPHADSTFVFDVICPGFRTQTISFEVKDLGKRERYRQIPMIFMERAPRQLKEVTVTASKIKFYNKGDTMVYNADAFALAEGSMLDALIAQLPGVELNTDGQIKVNGEFVEELLLNGQKFFDGNNNLMLENIAAYTVKNIEVYQGQTKKEKLLDDPTAPKHLTMDVKLKREYNMGWMLNAQGGYGTDDRYLGRVFASWFNPTTRLSLIGNVNNLNDNRKPGRTDTWTPDKMPSGTKETRMAGLNYNHHTPTEKLELEGSVSFLQSIDKVNSTVSRVNFLPGGDTYDYSYGRAHDRETKASTSHSVYFDNRAGLGMGGYVSGDYSYRKNAGTDIGGAFATEQADMSAAVLEALYATASPEKLAEVLNRSITRSDGWTKSYSAYAGPYLRYRLPHSSDNLNFGISADYQSSKEELWRDYSINYGANPAAADKRRQYTDNSPNHHFTLQTSTGYSTGIGNTSFRFAYSFSFSDRTKDSYMYAFERLNDMGIYGVVPAEYLLAFDPANSFKSRQIEGWHKITPAVFYSNTFKNKNRLDIRFNPQIGIVHRHLDYWRDNKAYPLSKTNATLTFNSIWDGMIEGFFAGQGEGRKIRWRHCLRYSYRIAPTLAELTDMIDVVNDADPLNIYIGNPGLKTQYTHRHLIRWQYIPFSHSLQNYFYIGLTHSDRELLRGYTYDTTTGVRTNRMYNVDGNYSVALTNETNWQFGRTKQFTITNELDIIYSRLRDMIGTDGAEPTPWKVNYNSFSNKFKFSWKIAKQTLSLRADVMTRHTASPRDGFRTINAQHYNYGLTGNFVLPAGFGINTDLVCYSRHGYGSRELDTTDPVWNARLTYTHPRHTRWVFMLDGFDLLQRLSNVKYSVTATGRTVSYTNALPRYVLFSVQYRLNIQPKKR